MYFVRFVDVALPCKLLQNNVCRFFSLQNAQTFLLIDPVTGVCQLPVISEVRQILFTLSRFAYRKFYFELSESPANCQSSFTHENELLESKLSTLLTKHYIKYLYSMNK